MTTRQERLAARRARIERKANTIIDEAVTRVVAARPIARIVNEEDRERITGNGTHPGRVKQAARKAASPSPPSAAGEPDPQEVKRLRDGGMAWWVIGQRLALSGPATSAGEPEAKRGAGRARALYAAANRGEVPRTNKPRAGATVRPTGPGRGGTVTSRKEQLVNEGHVIPRDMPDEEVQALLAGRTIEWAIDLARLTGTTPESWGTDSKRWVTNDAKVHVDERWVYVSTDEDTGERTVRFREYAGFDTDRQKHMSGPTRVVRVDSIFTIR
jgi:hypothetical protein